MDFCELHRNISLHVSVKSRDESSLHRLRWRTKYARYLTILTETEVEFHFSSSSIPPIIPRIPPAKNPPPMKRLRIAVGNITKAARTLNFRKIIMTATKRINPRMIPSMKLNELRAGTHGRKAPQKVVNAGDSRAIAFAMTRPAAIATNTAGSHHHLTSNGGFGNGPYHPGPNAPTGGATGPAP